MSARGTPPPFEILEHTADIGLRAYGGTLEELFETCAWGLAEILDVDRSSSDWQGRRVAGGGPPRSSRRRASGGAGVNSRHVHLREASDIEALLVDWMNELILLTEEGKACLGGVQVDVVGEDGLRARVELTDCGSVPEGTELKATTYHQLAVRQSEGRWEATVYFDV
ncbi:MAG TPA: archease [Actinomycetota bacterium]|nr:archease [Actinomycetota bacterium]